MTIRLPKSSEDAARERLFRLQEIPPPQGMALEAIRVIGDDHVDLGEVVAIIEKSPEFAARILRCANSAYYGYHRNIDSLKEAVIRVLGLAMTKNLILATALADSFEISCKAFSRERFWFVSVTCAQLCRDLAGALVTSEKPRPDVAYTAGLLHNLGLLALIHSFPELADEALTGRDDGESPNGPIEIATGLSPALAGEWLASRWGFPETIVQVMANHGHPGYRGPAWPLVRLVGFNAIVADRLFRSPANKFSPSPPPGDLLTAEAFNAAAARLTQQLDEMRELACLLANNSK